MLMGEVDLTVFGAERSRLVFTVNALQVEMEGNASSSGRGPRFPPGCPVRHLPGQRPGFHPGGRPPDAGQRRWARRDGFWAEVTTPLSSRPIESGDWAVLLENAFVQLRRKVRLIRQHDWPTSVDRGAALKAIEAAIRQHGEGVVEPAADAEPGEFQVAVDARGCYEITDPAGLALPNL